MYYELYYIIEGIASCISREGSFIRRFVFDITGVCIKVI